ncbi:hypothetical protein BST12_08755 [Mycobacterium angelicum]|uniref:Uncharacterized protein n=1 Tax=Mycobacterium angelicum TaxID=470074 RepID=A0A1W9ZY58_MYCAN|nr:hypothetical protein BST12_08755 [Mycobacterium angelicum]
MANASGATVIVLQSHPLWIAAQKREEQLRDEMSRHPAFLGRQRALAMGADLAAGHRSLRACPGDTPA